MLNGGSNKTLNSTGCHCPPQGCSNSGSRVTRVGCAVALCGRAATKLVGPSSAGPGPNAVRPYIARKGWLEAFVAGENPCYDQAMSGCERGLRGSGPGADHGGSPHDQPARIDFRDRRAGSVSQNGRFSGARRHDVSRCQRAAPARHGAP